MIHLDRNHHPSLSDHHKIISWSAHQPFNPDDFLSDALNTIHPQRPPTPNGTHTSSPASPVDPNSTSPTRDRSSSLSPAPETGSPIASPPPPPPPQPQPQPQPPQPPAAEEKEAPPIVPHREEEEEEDEQVNNASRQSTPLSELSPPPDQDDEPDVPEHTKSEQSKATGSENLIQESAGYKEPKTDLMKLKTNDHETSLTSSPRASTDAVPSEAKPTQKPLLTTNYMASSSITRLESPSRATPSIESPATPLASLFPTSPTQKSDPKVVSILELNSELLKVCIDFQSRGFAVSDMKFQQFSSRLQSNLTWLAAAADQSRNHLNMLLPIMDPPPSIDFAPTDRIRQLYAELPSIFAKEIARRSQIPSLPPSNVSSPNTPLKRERSDESPVDIALKRRNTGDSKSPSAMMPPPSLPSTSHNSSTHFSLPMSNGPNVGSGSAPPPPSSPQLSESQMSSINPGMMNTSEAQLAASNRERVRQAQIRAAQQQQASRQMSPPSMPAQQQMHGGPMSNMNVNAAAGPSNSSNMPSVNGVPDATLRQIYHVLRTPDHPFMRYMLRSQPNFQSLPTEVQVQRMMVAQNALQRQQQDQQVQNQQNQMVQSQAQRPGTAGVSLPNNLNPMTGMPMQNNLGIPGGQFSGGSSSSPVSPIPPQSPMMHQAQQNPMFSLTGNQGQSNAGIDPRIMMSGGGNMNINNLSPHQRQQLMLMQQQSSRFGGNSAPPNSSMMNMNPMSPMNMNMNPQQTATFAAQHQQRMAHGGSPSHPSPGTDGQGFPVLRSNSTIPGIARSTRSPSEAAPSPMTPRGPPARGSSLGQEDYQRMMMQQQHAQAQAQVARGMSSAPSPVYNQQQQQQHSQWPQNQNQNQGQQAMQMNMSMGQQGPYGMSPPGSAGGHYGGGSGGGSSAPSPSNSQSQNWLLQGQGNYPFAPSPGAAGSVHHSDHMQAGQIRHMSATPGPQQMSSQNMNSPTVPSPAEQPMPHDFDLFNWA